VPETVGGFVLTRGIKKELYGPHNFAPSDDVPGGQGGQDDDFEEDTGPELDTDVLPAFYHTMPASFYDELLHSYCGKAVVHLTAGDGGLALSCVHRKVPYIGVCLTDRHVEQLMEHLTERVFAAMQKEDHPLYQATMVVQLAPAPKTETEEGGPDGPKPAAEPKPKAKAAKAKAKPAGKAKAKAKAKAQAEAKPASLEQALAALDADNAAPASAEDPEGPEGEDDPDADEEEGGETW
jgi:hypothetical protein